MTVTEEFRTARDRLLELREDYGRARDEFEWPRFEHFNFALDWFDQIAADPTKRGRSALVIVEQDGSSTRRTFAELSERSSQVANWLRAQGVRRGDRMIVRLGNQVELWELMLAGIKLGVVLIPTTTLMGPADLADRVERGGAKWTAVATSHLAKFDGVPGDYALIGVGDDAGYEPGSVKAANGVLRYADSASADTDFAPDGPTPADKTLLLYFTSGTTSKSKLVEHTHTSYPIGHVSTMYWIGVEPGDVHLNVASPGWAKHLRLDPRPVGLMKAYYGDPQKTAEAFRDGYYHTGDMASRDRDGVITYVGRGDDVFKSSDYRLSPFELESVLIEHPAVAEAAVVPSPDPIKLSVPKAFVVLASGHQPSVELAQDILQFSRDHLAPFKRIRRLQFAELPKTISGKIRRVELRRTEEVPHGGGSFPEGLGIEYSEADFPGLGGKG